MDAEVAEGRDLAAGAIEDEPLAEEKGLTFTSACRPGLLLQGNRHLLAQALANLLDNAIKYTPAGGRVTLSGQPGPVITVADTGPGIPETERERVLERFVRLEGHRSTPGNGLGLSLVHAVAKLHGATLRLEDNHPGLRVSLALPGREVVGFGPGWARGYELTYFATVILVSLLLKSVFRIA